jgi:predicted TIM-barrel fold metal-dependent hydrolase
MHRVSGTSCDRRAFLAGAVGVAVGATIKSAHAERPIPIIDAHIHLFDPNRPQGAPYTGPPSSSTSKTGAFPAGYRKLAEPLGIVGAIEVEASPWIEDNLWVLEVSAPDDIIVGMVGNLRPEAAEFPEYLERYHRNPLFRGIRYGNLWDYDLVGQSKSSLFLERLKLLAQADLVLDTANPNVELLEAVVRVSDAVPELRIVIDHLPGFEPKPASQAAYEVVLRELAQRRQIYCKLSAVIHRIGDRISTDLATHKARLDHLYEVFGADRVIFGSDWPNSDYSAPIQDIVRIMREYFALKPRSAAEKYFWQNSTAAYKWIKRRGAQPSLA